MTRMTTLDEALAAASVPLAVALHQGDRLSVRSSEIAASRTATTLGIGLSDVSSCPRAVMYRERPPAGYVPDDEDKSAAIMGTLIHAGVIEILRQLYPWREYEKPVDVPGLDRPGHVDIYDPVLGLVEDLKTKSNWAAAKVRQDGPYENDWKQVAGYGFALRSAGCLVETLRLTYIDRSSGEVIGTYERDYDEDDGLAAVQQVTTLATRIELGAEIERGFRGPGLDKRCDFCPAVRHCWNLDALPEGRSAQSALACYDDPSTAIALADYAAVKPVYDKAKMSLDEAKVRIVGVPEGVYDGWALRWVGGSKGKVKVDVPAALDVVLDAYARAVAELNARDGERDVPDESDLLAGAEAAAALVLPQSRQGARAASATVTRAG